LFNKIKKTLIFLLLFYIIAGFFILPLILKPQLQKIIQQETNTKVAISFVYFNPLIFRLEVDDLTISDMQKKPLVGFKSLLINIDPSSLFIGAFEIKRILLESPTIHLVYEKNRTVNLLNILKKSKQEAESQDDNSSSTLPRVIIKSIKLVNGHIDYKDFTRKTPFAFSLDNIGFALKNIDTKDINQSNAAIRLYSTLGDGGFVDFKSKILSLAPLKLNGSLSFEASKLYTEWKYMQDVLNLEVADGKISFNAKYSLNLDDVNATKVDIVNLSLKKLRIKPKNRGKDVLNLRNLYAKNIQIKPFTQEVRINKVGLSGLSVQVKRYENGKFDWLEYLKIDRAHNDKNATAKENNETLPWSVSLKNLVLEKMSLDFDDLAVKPNVITKINELNIFAQNVTLKGQKPFAYQINMNMNENTLCNMQGTFAHKNLNLISTLNCKDFNVVHYKPYINTIAKNNLSRYDLDLNSLLADIGADVKVEDVNNSMLINVNKGSLALKTLKISKKSTKESLATFQNFQISGFSLDTIKRDINIDTIALNNLAAKLQRYKNLKFNIENLIIPKKAKQSKKTQQTKEPDYKVNVKTVALRNAKVEFTDKTVAKTQRQKIDKINVTLHNVNLAKNRWLNYKASMRINTKGIVRADGKLRHTPLKQSGNILIKDLSLVALTPYLQEKTFLSLDDGKIYLKAKESYMPSKKNPDLRLKGTFKLNSLFVTNRGDHNALLFSLNELKIKPFTLELFPNRLYIDEVNVDSFYVSAKIDENKTINFAKVMKPSKENLNTTSTPFPVKIVKMNVKNGSAEFMDLSLPIKFKTYIHDVNGVIDAISSTPGDTTHVDINGEIDKYGSTKLKGSLDSSNPKEYVDLDFNFKNLDLHSMSGYSASFAGYKIDSGKLFLDLGYKISHSNLNATNNITIKKIKLGDELEGENINHLPLGFVIGLLEDNDGIIDIDMPIEGNLDEPDFKYGALVWKTLGNLIVKAVASPFKFLGSMLGMDGEKLAFVSFEFGKSDITPPQREKLDQIAKIMNKRQKISLDISGSYDIEHDKKALKFQKLVRVVMKKSGVENLDNNKTALNTEMLEEVYNDAKDDDKLDKIKEEFEKQYQGKEFDRMYQNRLIEICTDIQTIDKDALVQLAQQREKNIKAYLVNKKFIPAERIKLGDIQKVNENKAKFIKVNLNIEVNKAR